MKLWGLTGGIASGKSTITHVFKTQGAHVLAADALYHGLLRPTETGPSPLAQRIHQAFPGVVDSAGHVNRVKLGQRVFNDPVLRQRLEALVHPAIAQAGERQFHAWRKAGIRHAVYDIPLLYEKNLESRFDGVVVVWVPLSVQKQRLMQRESISEEDALRRLAAQMPLETKRQRAHWVVDNSSTREHAASQVKHLWQMWLTGKDVLP